MHTYTFRHLFLLLSLVIIIALTFCTMFATSAHGATKNLVPQFAKVFDIQTLTGAWNSVFGLSYTTNDMQQLASVGSVMPFSVGGRVEIDTRSSLPLNVRSWPNGYVIDKVVTGVTGTITNGPLDSGDHIWWRVDFDEGASGWVVVEYLAR